MPDADQQQETLPESQAPAGSYQDAAAALAAGALVSTAAGVAPVAAGTVAGALAATAAAETSKALVKKLLDWTQWRYNHMWDPSGPLDKTVREEYPDRSAEDVMEILDAREREFEREFRRKMRERLERDIPEALKIEDPEKRAERLRAIFKREARYTAMREEAMLARAMGALEAELLQTLSPKGAYWKLSEHVKEHTLDCLVMGEKFWPWAVLRKIQPPLHYGCPCELFGLDEAIEAGFMTAEQVPDPKDAMRRYKELAKRVAELQDLGEAAIQELHEVALEEASVTRGRRPNRRLLRWAKGFVKGGEFRPTRGGTSERVRRGFSLPESPLTQRGRKRGRWAWVGGKYVQIPSADNWERRIDGRTYRSPAGGTNLYRDGELISGPNMSTPEAEKRPVPPPQAPPIPLELAEQIEQVREEVRAAASTALPSPGDGPSAVLALQSRGYRLTASRSLPTGDKRLFWSSDKDTVVVDYGKSGVKTARRLPSQTIRSRKPLTAPPEAWDDLARDSLAYADTLGKRFGARIAAPSIAVDDSLPDHAGSHEWSGHMRIGRSTPSDIARATRARKTRALNDFERRGLYASYWVTSHEIAHGVNPIRPSYFNGANANLEEALAEELSHQLAIERLRAHGLDEVVDWALTHPNDDKTRGVYRNERFALQQILDEAGIPESERHALLTDLCFVMPPEERLGFLAGIHADYTGEDWEESFKRVDALLAAPNRAPMSWHSILAPSGMEGAGLPEDGVLSEDGRTLTLPSGEVRRIERRKPFPDELPALASRVGADGTVVGLTTYPPGEPITEGPVFEDGTPKRYGAFRVADSEGRLRRQLRDGAQPEQQVLVKQLSPESPGTGMNIEDATAAIADALGKWQYDIDGKPVTVAQTEIGPDSDGKVAVFKTPPGYEIHGYFKRDGRPIGSFMRFVQPDQTIVHQQLSIEPEYRGLGIASAFFAASEEEYRRVGIKRILIDANGEGAFAWAQERFGFEFEDRIANAGNYGPHIFDDMRANLELRTDIPEDQSDLRAEAMRRLTPDALDGFQTPHEIANFGRERPYLHPLSGETTWLGREIMLAGISPRTETEQVWWPGVRRLSPGTALGPIPSYDGVHLALGKAAGGSNGARFADYNGERWLVKAYQGNADRVATELVANRIYALMGAPVADAGVLTMDGRPALAYPTLDGEVREGVFYEGRPSAALGRHYMTDALLANWDFVGLDDDNILWDPQGNPVRIDQGGTLEYRAQGGSKAFGPVPTEVWTLLRQGQAARASQVTEDEMRAQAAEIERILSPSRIDTVLDSAPFEDIQMRERVRDNLKARVEWMGRFSRGEESLPAVSEGDAAREVLRAGQDGFHLYSDEREALHAFDEEQDKIDSALQAGKPLQGKLERHVASIDRVLADSRTDEDLTLHIVGFGDAPDSVLGLTVENPGYLTAQFDETDGALSVFVPRGSSLVDLRALNGHAAQMTSPDVLLPRGSRLSFTKRDADGRLHAVLMPPEAVSGSLSGLDDDILPEPPRSVGTPPRGSAAHNDNVLQVLEHALDDEDLRSALQGVSVGSIAEFLDEDDNIVARFRAFPYDPDMGFVSESPRKAWVSVTSPDHLTGDVPGVIQTDAMRSIRMRLGRTEAPSVEFKEGATTIFAAREGSAMQRPQYLDDLLDHAFHLVTDLREGDKVRLQWHHLASLPPLTIISRSYGAAYEPSYYQKSVSDRGETAWVETDADGKADGGSDSLSDDTLGAMLAGEAVTIERLPEHKESPADGLRLRPPVRLQIVDLDRTKDAHGRPLLPALPGFASRVTVVPPGPATRLRGYDDKQQARGETYTDLALQLDHLARLDALYPEVFDRVDVFGFASATSPDMWQEKTGGWFTYTLGYASLDPSSGLVLSDLYDPREHQYSKVSAATRSPEGIATHEFGHAFSFCHLLPDERGITYIQAMEEEGFEFFERYDITSEEIAAVSEYALSRPGEAFAEMFAMYHDPVQRGFMGPLEGKFERMLAEMRQRPLRASDDLRDEPAPLPEPPVLSDGDMIRLTSRFIFTAPLGTKWRSVDEEALVAHGTDNMWPSYLYEKVAEGDPDADDQDKWFDLWARTAPDGTVQVVAMDDLIRELSENEQIKEDDSIGISRLIEVMSYPRQEVAPEIAIPAPASPGTPELDDEVGRITSVGVDVALPIRDEDGWVRSSDFLDDNGELLPERRIEVAETLRAVADRLAEHPEVARHFTTVGFASNPHYVDAWYDSEEERQVVRDEIGLAMFGSAVAVVHRRHSVEPNWDTGSLTTHILGVPSDRPDAAIMIFDDTDAEKWDAAHSSNPQWDHVAPATRTHYGTALHEFGHVVAASTENREGVSFQTLLETPSITHTGLDDKYENTGEEPLDPSDPFFVSEAVTGWGILAAFGITPEEVESTSAYAMKEPSEAFAELYADRFHPTKRQMNDDLADKFDRLLAAMQSGWFYKSESDVVAAPASPGTSDPLPFGDDFAEGQCHPLAIAVQQRFPDWKLAAAYSLDENGTEVLVHAFAYDPDTRMTFDAFGWQSASQAIERYDDFDRPIASVDWNVSAKYLWDEYRGKEDFLPAEKYEDSDEAREASAWLDDSLTALPIPPESPGTQSDAEKAFDNSEDRAAVRFAEAVVERDGTGMGEGIIDTGTHLVRFELWMPECLTGQEKSCSSDPDVRLEQYEQEIKSRLESDKTREGITGDARGAVVVPIEDEGDYEAISYSVYRKPVPPASVDSEPESFDLPDLKTDPVVAHRRISNKERQALMNASTDEWMQWVDEHALPGGEIYTQGGCEKLALVLKAVRPDFKIAALTDDTGLVHAVAYDSDTMIAYDGFGAHHMADAFVPYAKTESDLARVNFDVSPEELASMPGTELASDRERDPAWSSKQPFGVNPLTDGPLATDMFSIGEWAHEIGLAGLEYDPYWHVATEKRPAALPEISQTELAARTRTLPFAVHYSDDSVEFTPESSRWGHGGVYALTPEMDAAEDVSKRGPVAHRIPGPLRVFSVEDNDNGSANIWEGYGQDEAFNRLLFAVAAETGYPPEPGLGYPEERSRIFAERTNNDDPLPDSFFWVNYGHALQARLREKLESQGFDGIEIGGETIIWNYDRLSQASLPASPASPGTIDYRGVHQAPGPEDGSPLHNLSQDGEGVYPVDLYGPNGLRYYGGQLEFDEKALKVIQRVKGKPDAKVTIYRAVPKPDKRKDQIDPATLADLPVGTRLLDAYDQVWTRGDDGWATAEMREERLGLTGKPLTPVRAWSSADLEKAAGREWGPLWTIVDEPEREIHAGDWVTTVRAYAKHHGDAQLNGEYEILSKTVRAQDLFSEGNSLSEYGYAPLRDLATEGIHPAVPEPPRSPGTKEVNADPERVAALRTVLDDHIAKHGPYAYHRTGNHSIAPIEGEGIVWSEERHGEGIGGGRPGHVYLFVPTDDEDSRDYPRSQFRIDLRKLDAQKLALDEDFTFSVPEVTAEDVAAWDFEGAIYSIGSSDLFADGRLDTPQNIALSLEFGQVAYHDSISPEAIERNPAFWSDPVKVAKVEDDIAARKAWMERNAEIVRKGEERNSRLRNRIIGSMPKDGEESKEYGWDKYGIVYLIWNDQSVVSPGPLPAKISDAVKDQTGRDAITWDDAFNAVWMREWAAEQGQEVFGSEVSEKAAEAADGLPSRDWFADHMDSHRFDRLVAPKQPLSAVESEQ